MRGTYYINALAGPRTVGHGLPFFRNTFLSFSSALSFFFSPFFYCRHHDYPKHTRIFRSFSMYRAFHIDRVAAGPYPSLSVVRENVFRLPQVPLPRRNRAKGLYRDGQV
ncbi:hypothetical protein B0H17DRAFT_1184602 [Mycena rosella]|uniref:Uncharacterized protein n=1 Tax=Mycena rosella TaxID=1033263 RepID=A0AAD7CUT4_MYCRO|nr:hypothetical protein B0H17DRAFT_1184602 [Mycena rosella]